MTPPKYRQHQRIKNLETEEIREVDYYPTLSGLFLPDGRACYGLKRIVMRGGAPETSPTFGQGPLVCLGLLVVPQEDLENPELYAPMKMTSR